MRKSLALYVSLVVAVAQLPNEFFKALLDKWGKNMVDKKTVVK